MRGHVLMPAGPGCLALRRSPGLPMTSSNPQLQLQECGQDVVVMSKIVLLAALFSLTGCLHVRRSGYIIPAHCLRVSVQSLPNRARSVW